MRSTHDDVQWHTGRGNAAPAVPEELDVAQCAPQARAATGLTLAKRVSKTVRARRDFRTELKRVEPVVVAGNAHRRHAKLAQQTRDAPPSQLCVARQIAHKQHEIVSAVVEESDVGIVPEEMNITDHGNRCHLHGVIVHGTKLSRPRAAREREGTLR